MRNVTGLKNIISITACLLFCGFVIAHEFRAKNQADALIRQHAQIIANDIYNTNYQGSSEYLELAASSSSYRRLTVIDDLGNVIQQVIPAARPSILERILKALRLVPETRLTADVQYNGIRIGTIDAVWVSKTIFTQLQILFGLSMLTIILHLHFSGRQDNKILERRVADRTAELARSNRSLLMEIHQKRKSTTSLRKSEEEYRKLYKESKKAEEVYRSLIHSSADAILIYDLTMNVEYVSAAFTDLFGWAIEEIKGKPLNISTERQREAVTKIFSKLCHEGVSCKDYETQVVTKNGKILDISISASRFNDHTNQPTGILVVLRDLSVRKKLERQLQQADRMEAIGTLAGGIAHDFNNLLMGIQGNVSLALLDTPQESSSYEKLSTIANYVKNGEELTRQLLGFARGGKYEVKPTDLNQLAAAENKMFGRTRKDITIHETYQPEIWPVAVDRGQIKQVLLNLYVNASQAMPEGGDIYVTTHNITLSDVNTRPYEVVPGRYVQLSVTDTGTGMDKETLAKIFHPFFTTKEMGRGTGLGLASVYGIIKNHNGYIDVYSEVGEGTTFRIYLPVTDKKILTEETTATKFSPGAGAILLIDDEPMILQVGAEMLKTIGYTVHTADSGDKACDFYAANGHDIDLVILDMVMPDMDGGKIFDKLKTLNPKVKVILSSGYSLNGKASRIIDRGCEGFLQKPFDLTTLSAKVQEVM